MRSHYEYSAQEIALRAHHGQSNQHNAEPYILHVFRVAKACEQRGLSTLHVAVAWLHDVVEDTTVDLSYLHNVFPDKTEIVAAVDLLTKKAGMTNEEYYRRIKENSLAGFVKVRDMQDNFSRNHHITDEPTRLRMGAKYSLGMDILREFM